ncbi:TetR/AcrR family transcriptional regulator [Acrocarpospora catenulata]|uniref:TetR/AcrR family transcriptional regulator n=1 Tax=Acrocarpospora catenulata TaxID=2836182 RepID=UPI001BDA1AB5|nr:TetR/AcrR family transcriptional regulator [Acrocarpospora catenulata]
MDAAVLSAALELLAEVGYAGLTMEQVAVRAEVSKASLYLRWSNKAALAAEAMQRHADVVPDIPDTGSLAEDMRHFLHALLREQQRSAQALAAVSGEIANNPQLREAFRAGMTGTLVNSLRTMVTRAVDRGEIPATTDVELLSLLPVAVMQQWRLVSDHRPDKELMDRIVAQFFSEKPVP